MKIFLISYDLSKPERDYESLINAIQNFKDVIQLQKSVWLICTTVECEHIFYSIGRFVDKNDNLFVCPIEFKDMYCYSENKVLMKWLSEHNYQVQDISQTKLHQS